jgi:hypothetical protein
MKGVGHTGPYSMTVLDILGGICLCEPSSCFMLRTLLNQFFRLLLGSQSEIPSYEILNWLAPDTHIRAVMLSCFHDGNTYLRLLTSSTLKRCPLK